MAKKIFLVFTIVMVIITSAICYSMVNAAISRKPDSYKKIPAEIM
jgi:hypothetical protein